MLKLKGRYAVDLQLHQDPSALIIPKIAMQIMVNDKDIDEQLKQQRDPFDYMLRAKVPNANRLYMRWKQGDEILYDQRMQKITRFFVSNNGGYLINIKPQSKEIGQFKRANKLSDDYFNDVMIEIGKDVWDSRIHTKNKKVYEPDEETGICAGFNVTECNNSDDFNWSEINYDWYKKQIEKIIIK
jgi:hypothetical protein